MPRPDVPNWQTELPTLAARQVILREPVPQDLGHLVELLSAPDATRFGLGEAPTELAVQRLIEQAVADRAAGTAFTYAVTLGSLRPPVGLIQVRQLDPAFEVAEWECTLAPKARGGGVFVEAMRLVGSFAFDAVGVRRLETRVLLRNGRGNTALRKLGAVEEGILRRAARRDGEYLDQVLWSLLREDWGDRWISTAPRFH
ncbi:MAG TPA: GNAT family protein [Vicinamibacterales bacterium]|jgi:RimJ/RimL family protein N-acetyltransferase|nr:GNAT family protein [Vicinamibacterales bacterium]